MHVIISLCKHMLYDVYEVIFKFRSIVSKFILYNLNLYKNREETNKSKWIMHTFVKKFAALRVLCENKVKLC